MLRITKFYIPKLLDMCAGATRIHKQRDFLWVRLAPVRKGPAGNHLSTCLSGVEDRGSVCRPADVSGRLDYDVIEVLPRRHVAEPNVVRLKQTKHKTNGKLIRETRGACKGKETLSGHRHHADGGTH